VLHVPRVEPWDSSPIFALSVRRLDALLNVGAALLAAGTIEIWAFYAWPAAQMSEPGAAVFFSIAKTMSSVAGAFFSVVLISIYVPAVIVLRRRLAMSGLSSSVAAVDAPRAAAAQNRFSRC